MQKCIVCGKIYTSKRGRKYCSDTCRRKQWKLKNRDRYLSLSSQYNKRRWQRIKPIQTENICVNCGKSFMPNGRTPYQKYCSSECRVADFQRNHREEILNWKKSERLRHRDKYKEINSIYKDKIRYGGNRIKALERDDYECQYCGATENLAVHHIDGSGQTENPNQELANLQTLCGSCHARIHQKSKLNG